MALVLQNLTKFGYQKIVRPIIFMKEPTDVHEKMLSFAEFSSDKKILQGMLKASTNYESQALAVEAFGRVFENPIGLAAGMDKKGNTLASLLSAGFGFATLGSITNGLTPGNPKPWFHRFPEHKAMLVHVGLRNDGVDKELKEIAKRAKRHITEGVNFPLKISLALTNDGVVTRETAVEDLSKAFEKTLKADDIPNKFVELNISCPNTNTGQMYKDKELLLEIFNEIDKKKYFAGKDDKLVIKMPILEDKGEYFDLLDMFNDFSFIDGLTISNLRKDRKAFEIPEEYKGNLSGAPTQAASDLAIKETYKKYHDRFTLIGVGGIFTAEDAYRKIKNGASLVEIITALIYQGPQVVAEIKRGLADLLEKDGYSSIMQAKGVDVL